MTLAQCVRALSELCEHRIRGELEAGTLARLFSVWRLRAEICVAHAHGGGRGTPIA